MNIVIVSPGMEHDGNTLKEKSLGGSETAAIQLAEALADKERTLDPFGRHNLVTVFSPCKVPVRVANVNYLPIQAAETFCGGGDTDLLIVSRAWAFLKKTMNAKCVFFWSHDLGSLQEAMGVRSVMWQIDRLLALTEFHKSVWKENYGITDEAFEIIRNGIDLTRFPGKRPLLSEREKGLMVMSGRPERGWDNLLKPGGIMERLLNMGVPAKLVLSYYDNPNPAFQAQYDTLFARARQLPNVEVVGSLTKDKLYELYSKAWLYAYASNWEETSCISAMESAACGLPILTTDIGGLKETVKSGTGIKLPAPAHKEWQPGPFRELDEAYISRFTNEIAALYRDDLRWERMSRAAFDHGKTLSWYGVGDRLVNLADDILRSKSANARTLYKHFFRLSDIEMCRKLEPAIEGCVYLVEREREYIKNNISFDSSPEAYKEQYEHVAENLGEGAFEAGEFEPRTQILLDFIRQNTAKIYKILDVGCAHGMQTIRMANLNPNFIVHGVDVSENQIGWAEKEAVKYAKHNNVRFYAATPDEMEEKGQYDLVVLNEILEHVPDPAALIAEAERACKPGGLIFITVPFGPWEILSHDSFKWRCHIRHYEMGDLHDLFSKKKDFEMFFRQTGVTPDRGEPLGHHYVIYVNSEAPTGVVNYERKMAWQSPRQTVSLCMIAYNAEDMLHRALKSIKGVADEIIIAVDPKTTDSTPDIARQYGAKIVPGINPMEFGFDEARNNSIKHASGEWVLWVDSDEELLLPQRLHKYLRKNILSGYAIQQHHLSVDPPMNMKPDLPVRLFRNFEGTRFFGVCHEHPEKSLNEGIGLAMVLEDTWIAHDGYLTENVRRNRFLRNIGLVQRDREKYPTRILGHFLWLRDLIHMCRYTMETNGNAPSPQILAWCREAQTLFEAQYLDKLDDPMCPEAIGYYSEANRLLGQGVPIQLTMAVAGQPPKNVMAQFRNAELAGRFMSNLGKIVLKPFESRYL